MLLNPSFFYKYSLVKQLPIFSQLGWLELHRITSKSIIDEYKKGDLIRKEGDPADYFYCLVSGRLQAYSKDEHNHKRNVEFIHRGVYFGIISLFTGENHSMTFEAMNDSVILKINKDDFHDILKAIPRLGIEVNQVLSKRIRRKVKGDDAVFDSTVISVYSPTKGTGKSTYAINLALGLKKETRKKVIYVSIQPKQDKREEGNVKEDKLRNKWKVDAVDLNEISDDHEKIQEHIIRDDLPVDLLNIYFDTDDPLVKNKIAPFVSDLIGEYYYVVVDLPNSRDNVVLETLTQSDLVHLVTQDKNSDFEAIRKIIDRLEEVLKEGFKEEKIRVIISGIHPEEYLSFEDINKFIDYHVYTKLPFLKEEDMEIESSFKSLNYVKIRKMNQYNKVVKHIAREIGKVLVGLALGGGAALGIAHIGIIRVLEQEGIDIDMVTGSSMGALIGSLWVTGKSADDMEKIAREFEQRSSLLGLIDPILPISGVIGGESIKKWLKKHLGNKTFYDARIPFKVIAYDLARRQELVINGGSIVEAVCKSIAIPGVFQPVREKDRVIIDGGVMNPLPTNVLVSEGIKKIISVNVLQSPGDILAGFETSQKKIKERNKIGFLKSPGKYLKFKLGRMVSSVFDFNISDIIVNTLQAAEYVIAEQSAQQADVAIHPDLVGVEWYEIYKVNDLIKRGEDAARAVISDIKKLVEEKE
ncbi:MAG: hypothetical protein A2Y03_08675 [Omnitrophica WOR_2 bacterium GWF2_38_59]|nr:MAG: hypothetical protein A2Y03_08675 [Omnitrophica WOR_2 bacterium GWF2_38_59]OGX47015.1 MAG: hypothetical protein A2243_09235 [Omnitrophica WOR_2 bacterium RIFOXYA2_FULL_38_17]OGX50957.1 MAG: hypothetical protein A2267_00265 [Omnitrophica WOR_2 bacterium RIFOXYA12_FULL_38_10]OGX55620.1 MAG: hypothetical protein A2306_02425 [Omnitrophica WOR_2 bacterium RIFOXYB2_FULL_38_16]OGX56756.1 MAG: hypothetical protein A2447_00940 [Omnitrophica WOR_2 bacterium RIFOXYC2_FULL_38_12]HBG62387.1 hypothet